MGSGERPNAGTRSLSPRFWSARCAGPQPGRNTCLRNGWFGSSGVEVMCVQPLLRTPTAVALACACACPRMARPQPPPTSATEAHQPPSGMASMCSVLRPLRRLKQNQHELTLNCGPTEHRLLHRPLKARSVAVHQAARRRVERVLCIRGRNGAAATVGGLPGTGALDAVRWAPASERVACKARANVWRSRE